MDFCRGMQMPIAKKLKDKIKTTKLGQWYREYRHIPIRLRLLNFLVHRVFGLTPRAKWSIHFTSCLSVPQGLHLGKGVARSLGVSGDCYIQAINGVYIGDETLFAPGVKIISANHTGPTMRESEPAPPIRIGQRCWIGANAVILPGGAGRRRNRRRRCGGDQVISRRQCYCGRTRQGNPIPQGTPRSTHPRRGYMKSNRQTNKRILFITQLEIWSMDV